jgi:leader peptidase (prepilin peptidase) / N-methyltransferase
METSALYELIFRGFAFMFGAAIGSFLNVCIYRLPRDLSVNEPRRSFCPSCKNPIPWQQNLPLLSWLVLRGKCASCGSRIAFRYFAVELLTALLFLAVWLVFPWPIALVYCVFVSLLVAATFIDFEHFIIPDEITIGGTIAGVLASVALPALMGEDARWRSGAQSLGAAALGYALLWIVLELGKRVFGKKSFRLAAPTSFSWTRRVVITPDGEDDVSDADLVVGDVGWKSRPPPMLKERLRALWKSFLRFLQISRERPDQRGEMWIWSEIFTRESDQLTMLCTEASIDSDVVHAATLNFSHQKLTIGERTWSLDNVNVIEGTISRLVIPREAMGRGDLKFLAAIGAFLGWRAVLFSIFAGSLAGSIVGLTSMLLGRRAWSAKIPFGPYLALGGLVWMFFGGRLIAWYVGLLAP